MICTHACSKFIFFYYRERRCQTLAVLLWISTFFLMGPLTTLFLLYLFIFTRFGFISLLYLAWLIYDKDICNRGGRRYDFPHSFLPLFCFLHVHLQTNANMKYIDTHIYIYIYIQRARVDI